MDCSLLARLPEDDPINEKADGSFNEETFGNILEKQGLFSLAAYGQTEEQSPTLCELLTQCLAEDGYDMPRRVAGFVIDRIRSGIPLNVPWNFEELNAADVRQIA